MSDESKKKTGFWNKVVNAKVWQLLLGTLIVAAVSVSLTVTVNAVNEDNARHAEADSQTSTAVPNDGQQKRQQDKPHKSRRGNLIKKIGDVAAIKTKSGKTIASWTLTKIDTAPECTVEQAKPTNGHYVTLSFDVETSDASTDIEQDLPLFLGSPAIWQYYLKDGTLWNGNPAGDSYGSGCIADSNELLPGNVGAGTRASGKIVFDIPSTDGILVYNGGSTNGGWEYSLSAEHST